MADKEEYLGAEYSSYDLIAMCVTGANAVAHHMDTLRAALQAQGHDLSALSMEEDEDGDALKALASVDADLVRELEFACASYLMNASIALRAADAHPEDALPPKLAQHTRKHWPACQRMHAMLRDIRGKQRIEHPPYVGHWGGEMEVQVDD